MANNNNHIKFLELRNKYPVFEYKSYSYTIDNDKISINYCFIIGENHIFYPKMEITSKDFMHFIDSPLIDNIIFNIGMVELVSYWKASCAPKVIIRCGLLSDEQVLWWKKLYFNGLGEFFYLNGIETDIESFMDIKPEGKKHIKAGVSTLSDKVLVPVGGGKDSVVSLEILKESGFDVVPMVVNPREASVRTIETSGFDLNGSAVVNRYLDKHLLELNDRGFLNGHTPFSALLAFVNVLVAALGGIKYIALSNESSANESTVPGTNINHQYSKSFEFEVDFNNYLSNYITDDIHYFSFLRPLNELQIASLFSGFDKHFDGFRSCNVGSKSDSWCGKCPKCLFTYIILSPFIEKEKLLSIFGKNMLDDMEIENYFLELTGRIEVKPFECVGTPDEVNASLGNMKSPVLNNSLVLKNYKNNYSGNFTDLLNDWNSDNMLPDEFENVLKYAINEKNA